jgi:hypothetical protein
METTDVTTIIANIAFEWIMVPNHAPAIRADHGRHEQGRRRFPVDGLLLDQNDGSDDRADREIEPARGVGLVRCETKRQQNRQNDRYAAPGQNAQYPGEKTD